MRLAVIILKVIVKQVLCDITYQIITDNSRIKDTNERKREFKTVVIIVGNKRD